MFLLSIFLLRIRFQKLADTVSRVSVDIKFATIAQAGILNKMEFDKLSF